MPKDIKVIKCPNCGSIHKTEIKPDFYRCDNCQTEYYLDNDDINVNINYRNTPQPDLKPPIQKAAGWIVMFLVIFVIIIVFFVIPSGHKSYTSNYTPPKKHYDFLSNGDLVYTNTTTNSPVYLRIGREDIDGPNNSVDYVKVHTVFIDPISKKVIKDVLLFPKVRRLDDHDCYFHIFMNGDIYAIYNKSLLFRVDPQSNTLSNVTQDFIKKHTELNSGIASMTLGTDDDYISILTNDGTNLFYSPLTDKIYANYKGPEDAKFKTMKKPFYQFVDTDRISISRVAVKLLKFSAAANPDSLHFKNITGNRKFFEREIIYQNPDNLLIFVHISAGEKAPTSLQSIDVNTGKVKWALAKSYSFSYDNAVKCKQGFALHYSSGEDMDYISGVYIIAPDGKIVSDYLLGRAE
jgi:hypothetical protein